MKLKKKQTIKEFIFEDVITLDYWVVALVIITIASPIFLFSVVYLYPLFKMYGMALATLFMFGSIFYFLSFLKKTVIIKFDTKNKLVYINTGKREIECPMEDIKGFYSHDYLNRNKSIISIQFQLQNGEKIEITDFKFTNEFEEEKHKKLSRFLRVAIQELGFQPLRKSKRRWLQWMGFVWYSRPKG
ncbi:hypothetical protein AAG747_25385 [Rapidithrix thailandica]|uniref:Photosystem I assembly protein Ycf4 n=1 Tax=Rapidithrix thailandica TaxID=413964 RepID=A0AAW9SKA8_9BACT